MLNNKEIVLGSRNSLLARAQTLLVILKLNKLGFHNIKTRFIISTGDNLRGSIFKAQGGKGLFTKDIDTLLDKREIDLGVHSAKDIPAILHNNLKIGAYLKREDVRDVLITKDPKIKKINELPKNSKLGSSSPRRTCYVNYLRPDIEIVPIRGNIDTRINKLKNNDLGSIIIAQAGINRLKKSYSNLNLNPISISEILPAPGQGAVAIVHKREDEKLEKICKLINNKDTENALLAERALIKAINGDCFTPIGALANINKETIYLKARLFSNNGKLFSDSEVQGSISDNKKIGIRCANNLISKLRD